MSAHSSLEVAQLNLYHTCQYALRDKNVDGYHQEWSVIFIKWLSKYSMYKSIQENAFVDYIDSSSDGDLHNHIEESQSRICLIKSLLFGVWDIK